MGVKKTTTTGSHKTSIIKPTLQTSSEMNVTDVPISMIIQEDNSRSTIREHDLHELMDSIKTHGLLQPIGLFRKGSKYSIIFGNRRFTAFKKLRRAHIPAIVFEDEVVGQDFLLKNLTENIQRLDITVFDLGKYVFELTDRHGYTLSEVASTLSKPIKALKNALDVYTSLPKKFQGKVTNMAFGNNIAKKGKIAASIAALLVDMQKRYAIPDKEMDGLYIMASQDNTLTSADINILSKFLAMGYTLDKAVKMMEEYEVVRPLIAIHKKDLAKIMDKYGKNYRKFFSDVLNSNKVVPMDHSLSSVGKE